jgi:predicted transcriptional regulator
MKDTNKEIQEEAIFNSPLGVGGNIQDESNKVPLQGLGAKGSTAKYLREKLGGIPEQAKENLKEFNRIKKLMLEALKEQDLTVIQMSEKINMPTDQVVYYLMSLVKYGFVKTGDVDDMDEYYTYKLNK